MQKEYREADPREREYVFNKYIKNDIFNLSKDTYMHYVLETILEVGNHINNFQAQYNIET